MYGAAALGVRVGVASGIVPEIVGPGYGGQDGIVSRQPAGELPGEGGQVVEEPGLVVIHVNVHSFADRMKAQGHPRGTPSCHPRLCSVIR